jgi:acyl dehydratase
MAEITLAAVPSSLSLYRKAIVKRGGSGGELPGDRLQLADQRIEAERLWRYQQLCGFRVSDVLLPTYLHLLAFPLGMALMTQPAFPFPLLGLIHVGNEITQLRPVRADERITVRAWAANLRSHPSGRAVDLLSEALVGDEPVWREVSSYLHREQSAEAKQERTDRKPAVDPTASGPVIQWRVPADIGRRYAAVSGDRNPIHLHDLTAKVFGFRGAIAHGMWLKARTLAAFAGRLPDQFRVEVAFKTPVFLPSTVELRVTPTETPTEPSRRIEVRNVRSDKPHLTGTITNQ